MTWGNDDAFGGFWDLGGSVAPDLISYPIQKIIARDALRDGIDINTPFRRVASFGASRVFRGHLTELFAPQQV
jgi:hypothetical protein